MKKYLTFFIFLLSVGIFSDSAIAKSKKKFSKPPFEVYSDLNYFGMMGIRITSLTDGLIVKDIILNNGRCDIASDAAESHLGVSLEYGESRFFLMNCSHQFHVLKTQIVTNTGTWNYQLRRPAAAW
ncbi:hypothetical protein ACWIYZ_01835 [Ursidibacter arcticus]